MADQESPRRETTVDERVLACIAAVTIGTDVILRCDATTRYGAAGSPKGCHRLPWVVGLLKRHRHMARLHSAC
jgi:hypothetical protein